MLQIEYRLPIDAEIIQEGFDSIIIECRIDQETEIDMIVRESFNKTLYWKGQGFTIPIDRKEGRRWEK
jgi:hypothetical protein